MPDDEGRWAPRPSLVAKPTGEGPAPLGDLVVAIALLGLAAFAAWRLPAGTTRLALTLPALAIVPGYVLLQAVFVPVRPALERAGHAVFALGLSPAYLAILALTTTFGTNGFRAGPILVVTLAGTVILAVAAILRRRAWTPAAAARDAERHRERSGRKDRPTRPAPASARAAPAPARPAQVRGPTMRPRREEAPAATAKTASPDEQAWHFR